MAATRPAPRVHRCRGLRQPPDAGSSGCVTCRGSTSVSMDVTRPSPKSARVAEVEAAVAPGWQTAARSCQPGAKDPGRRGLCKGDVDAWQFAPQGSSLPFRGARNPRQSKGRSGVGVRSNWDMNTCFSSSRRPWSGARHGGGRVPGPLSSDGGGAACICKRLFGVSASARPYGGAGQDGDGDASHTTAVGKEPVPPGGWEARLSFRRAGAPVRCPSRCAWTRCPAAPQPPCPPGRS